MKFFEYSHRHGKELLKLLHPTEYNEIIDILNGLAPFPHGREKMKTPKRYIANEFNAHGWGLEKEIPLGTNKSDYCDIVKDRVYMEQEYSKFETLFRDFLRFLLLYDSGALDVAVLICYDESAFSRWADNVKSYRANRATLQRARDFLTGSYRTVIRAPIWVIGIE